MNFKVVAFNKLRTPGLRDAADHFLKMLGPWVSVQEIEIRALSVPDKSEATRRAIQEKEAELLLQSLKGTRYYLLDEGGALKTTAQWAELARGWETGGSSSLALCIGSSLGFADRVRSRAAGRLSLGPQTLSHELARVVLLEQLYRAWSVLRGHPYHNAGS